MNITLRFFGQLRELTGTDQITMAVKEKTRIEHLVCLVGERFPKIRDHLKHVSFSIDNEYAAKGAILQEGSEVGVLPPISGG